MVRAGRLVTLPAVPIPFLASTPLLEGAWIDLTVLKLAEFGAILADRGGQVPIDESTWREADKSAGARVGRYRGGRRRFGGRTYVKFALYQRWRARTLGSRLEASTETGFVVSDWNDWVKNQGPEAALAGVPVEPLTTFVNSDAWTVHDADLARGLQLARVDLLAKLTRHATQPPSLLEKRERLRDALTRSDSRVVVLIDDIDRLEPNETRELMRLVRLTSDLPNIVFLLAFDRRRVARSLSRAEDEEEGQQYLDKILQITYDLPTVHEAILPDRFFTWLEELLQGREVGQLDKPVWGRVFYEVIKPLLGNLRHVKRYLSSLPVTLDTIGPEVALADLLGMEAFRVLRPRLFEELKAHSDCLVHPTSVSQSWLPQEERHRQIKNRLKGMLERAGDDRAAVESILELLFPATQGLVGNESYGAEWSGTWRKQRRVACEEVLRIYLNAGLDDGALALSEVQDLVGALTDQNQFAQLVDALDDQRFERALERLEDYQHEFPVEAVGIAVPVLVNRMRRLSAHSTGLHVSPQMKASRVILRLLRRIENQNALADSVDGILAKIDTLSGRQCIVEMVGHRGRGANWLVDEDQAKTLEDRLLERLESATAEQLAEEWNLFALLVRPLSWLDEEDRGRLTARLREHLSDDGFVLALLRLAVVDVSTNGHVSKQFEWDSLIDAVGEGLAEAVGRLAESQLYENGSTEDRQAVELAQKYVSGWRPEPWGGLLGGLLHEPIDTMS